MGSGRPNVNVIEGIDPIRHVLWTGRQVRLIGAKGEGDFAVAWNVRGVCGGNKEVDVETIARGKHSVGRGRVRTFVVVSPDGERCCLARPVRRTGTVALGREDTDMHRAIDLRVVENDFKVLRKDEGSVGGCSARTLREGGLGEGGRYGGGAEEKERGEKKGANGGSHGGHTGAAEQHNRKGSRRTGTRP